MNTYKDYRIFLKEVKNLSAKGLSSALKRLDVTPFAIVLDGTVTSSLLRAAEEHGCKVIAAKNFATTDTNIQLLSFRV